MMKVQVHQRIRTDMGDPPVHHFQRLALTVIKFDIPWR